MQELETYRKLIREINGKILLLLKERLDVVKKIGEVKKREDIPLRNVEVEDSQIQELRIQGEALGLDSAFIEDIFRRTIAYAIEVEEKMGA